ncbi:unnamed protein product [Kuraishia capsulata CBS 1993]|uniref:Riboflavin synthase n=1 Tax=Kuraishia capsulata CBS 1993 TaxID=1382522 RepID=W6MPU5_9ASCO|nr:uncharacterized protein KUCA_T00004655001 [Kuraishia capsulata CBS 1993]CDK28671.1 unnamed protein product [Kuraishia capsulata CBS 1993]
MFTGIVEVIGVVSEYQAYDTSESGGSGVSITITECSEILVDVHLGDSIAVNGTCLTVTEFDKEKTWFKVGVSPETLALTNLGDLKAQSKVNLERAISGEVRFGGHVVQGHVDTIATIQSVTSDENSLRYTFKLRDAKFIAYIVHKGFICLDGTSLTITDVDQEKKEFSIMMVAYTQSKVVMPLKKVGDTVNVEVDLTGKLVENQVRAVLENQIENKDSSLVKLITQIVEKKVSELVK